MAKGRTTTYIFLFVLFVLPLLIYFLFRGLSSPVFLDFPYAYTLTSSGDTLYYELPEDFAVVGMEGDTIRREDLLGQMHVLSIFHEKEPRFARVLNGNLRRIYDNIDEAGFVSILSIHMTDSVPLSQRYIDSMEVNDAWTFANAPRETCVAIGQALGMEKDFRSVAPSGPPYTAQMVALVDMEGRVRKYVYGTDLVGIRQLNEDIRALWLLEYKGGQPE